MKFRTHSVLFDGSIYGPVSAVQDHFGKCYRAVDGFHQPGAIVAMRIYAQKAARQVGKDESVIHLRILAGPIHASTVRAMVKKTDWPDRPLVRGRSWYEVLSD